MKSNNNNSVKSIIHSKNIIFVFCVMILIIAAFIKPWTLDEGWDVSNAKYYTENGVFKNVIFGTSEIFRKPYYFLLGIFGELTDWEYYFVFRLVNLFIGIFCLYLLRHLLKDIGIDKLSYNISLFVFVLWQLAPECGISARMDNIYVFSVIFSIFSAYYVLNGKTVFLYISLIINGICFAVFPLALAGFFINLISFIMAFKIIKRKEFIFIFSALAASIVLFLLLLAFDRDIVSFFKILFTSGISSGIVQPWYMEPKRYLNLFIGYPVSIPFFIFGIIYLISTVKSIRKMTDQKFKILIVISFFVSLAILLLFPRKWYHHFSLIIPFIVFLNAWFFDRKIKLENEKHFNLIFLIFLFCVFLPFVSQSVINSVHFQENFSSLVKTKWLKKMEDIKNLLTGKIVQAPIVFYPYLNTSYLQNKCENYGEIEYEILYYDNEIDESNIIYITTFRFEGKYYNLVKLIY